MNNSNFTFSIKFETQEKFSKLLQNLSCNKAMRQYDIPIKILKENSGIFSYVLCHSFSNSLLLIFKTKNSLNPLIMEDVLNFKNLAYNFRNAETPNRSNVSSVKYGTGTITSLGAKIWKILPNDYNELTSLSTFKSKFKNWEAHKCPCRLCKTYIQRVGFI